MKLTDHIKNRHTGEIMLGGLTLEVVIERHRKWICGEEGGERANLSSANLIDANLRFADLSGANLHGADLIDAELHDANLRCANLIGAELRGAILSSANLSDAPFKIENIHQKVYEAASREGALNMRVWHGSCGTAHCRAGWVVTLAGEAGRALEWALGTPAAAALIYAASDPNIGKIPDFYCDNATALADMKARADAEKAAA